MAFPLITPKSQFFDSSGSPLSGGSIEFLNPSDDTFLNTYPTADDADAQTNANANPVTLDSSGRASIYLEDGVKYKVVLRDADGVVFWTEDDVRSPLYSTASVQAQLYGRSAAEIAAGVTPTDFSHPPGYSKRYGATGDGSTNDTAALTTWLGCGEPVLVLQSGTYITTGNVLPADSGVGRIEGEGFAELRREGEIDTGVNNVILAVYKNRVHISNIRFNGLGTTIAPADPTLYSDLTLNSNVGSADNTDVQDNLTVVTDCYFYDAPGSCIAGAGMQSAIIQNNKFEEWRDHAVYPTGDSGTGQGLGADIIVDGNIFWMTGTVSNGAVKCRNNVQRFVISNNTFNIGGERAIDIHGGVQTGTDYAPLDIVVTGNTGSCGIFAGVFADTSSTQSASANYLFADNNMRCADRAFYLGDSASAEFLGTLTIEGGTYENTSGSFKAFLDCRFLDTSSTCKIELQSVTAKNYGVGQGYYPVQLVLDGCTFDQTFGGWWLFLSFTDDSVAKTVHIENSKFYDGGGVFDLNVNDSSSAYIRGNYYRGGSNAVQLRDLPLLLVFEGNTIEDCSGVELADNVTARSTDGEIFLESNKCISTSGASTVPRLFEETITTAGTTALDSYNIYAIDNFFKDVTGGLASSGSQVTGYSGSNVFYTKGNYGTGSTFAISYPAANRSSFLPALQGIQEYVISNESTDRVYDANSTTVEEIADVLATLLQDLGHGA